MAPSIKGTPGFLIIDVRLVENLPDETVKKILWEVEGIVTTAPPLRDWPQGTPAGRRDQLVKVVTAVMRHVGANKRRERHPFSEEMREKIVRLSGEGVRPGEIARRLGTNRMTVWRTLKREETCKREID